MTSSFITIFTIALILGGAAAYQFRQLPKIERLLLFLAPFVILVFIEVMFDSASRSLTAPWNNARLAPSYAMFHGYPLYQDMESPHLTPVAPSAP